MVRAAKQKADATELAVDLDLLQGRVLSAWRGHNGEALALYDQLAEVRPPQQSHAAGHTGSADQQVAGCITPQHACSPTDGCAATPQAHPEDFRPVLAKALVLKRCSDPECTEVLRPCCMTSLSRLESKPFVCSYAVRAGRPTPLGTP